MKALPGRTYAQIIGEVVHWTFTAAELPEWNDAEPGVTYADITDLDPLPQQGWSAAGDPPVFKSTAGQGLARSNGRARKRRLFERLAKTDPLKALLTKEGIK